VPYEEADVNSLGVNIALT